MKQKTYVPTQHLVEALQAHDSFAEFLKENQEGLGQEDFKIHIRLRMFECGLELAEIFNRAHLKPSYAYQILNGQRRPTRDKIIQFAFGMGLGLDAANQLLSSATKQTLYAKRTRDAAIMHALIHGQSIESLNQHLKSQALEPLYAE